MCDYKIQKNTSNNKNFFYKTGYPCRNKTIIIYIKYLYGTPVLLYAQWQQSLKFYATTINFFFVSIQNQFLRLIHVHVA